VSNALLVGEVFGQVIVGIICDRVGRKTAMVGTTLFIVIGGILATASGPTSNPAGMFWMLTIARGMVGVGVGGEYPACSTSASESANEKFGRDRGKIFILVTNLMLSIGSPIVISLALLILGGSHYGNTVKGHDEYILQYTWRVLMAIGVVIPLTVFYFRLKMMNRSVARRCWEAVG
jgi:MFS family permease